MLTNLSTRFDQFAGAAQSKETALPTPLVTRNMGCGAALQGWKGGLWAILTVTQFN